MDKKLLTLPSACHTTFFIRPSHRAWAFSWERLSRLLFHQCACRRCRCGVLPPCDYNILLSKRNVNTFFKKFSKKIWPASEWRSQHERHNLDGDQPTVLDGRLEQLRAVHDAGANNSAILEGVFPHDFVPVVMRLPHSFYLLSCCAFIIAPRRTLVNSFLKIFLSTNTFQHHQQEKRTTEANNQSNHFFISFLLCTYILSQVQKNVNNFFSNNANYFSAAGQPNITVVI